MRLFKQTGSIIKIRPNSRIVYRCLRSFTSNTLPEPPLVVRMRTDMKDAMREKDKNRYACEVQFASSVPLLASR